MTSLQKQLAAIAASSTHQLDLKAQKAAHGKSLLFEPRLAASQSFETLYQICYDGYRALCALEPRFAQFSQSLFSEQSKAEDRLQMTRAENEKLDRVLEAFVTMVGPWLLLKPAEKALEWLVRRFRVHEYNTVSLVMTYLPYHDTPQFLALLSILPSSPPPALRFLHPYIQSPTNPPRRTIVYTAVNTPAFFTTLQNHVSAVLEAGHQSTSLLSFWSSVTTQAIDGILDQSSSGRRDVQDQKTEELLLRVLPVLNTCMRIANGSEAVTACYMIVIVLVTKAVFEDKILDSLMEAVVLSQDTETLEPCLMCLAVIAEERSQVQLPPAVIKRLLRISPSTQTFAALSKRCRIDRLILGYALGALRKLEFSASDGQTFREILESGLLDDAQLAATLSALLQLVQRIDRGSSQYGQLVDYVSALSDSPVLSQLFEAAAKQSDIDLESLGLVSGQPMQTNEAIEAEEDEEMLDVDGDQQSMVEILPPQISVTSFLNPTSSQSISVTLSAFEKAVESDQSNRFLAVESFRRKSATTSPLFFSFLARAWCCSGSVGARVKALRSLLSTLKALDTPLDLQNLTPYLIHALADPSTVVRRSAASCIAALSNLKTASGKNSTIVWGSSDLYGKESAKIPTLSTEHASVLLALLQPILEECIMDANFVLVSLKAILEGDALHKNSKTSLKSSSRGPIISFLAAHVAASPILGLRLRLISLFNFIGKSSVAVRTTVVLPLIRDWVSLPNLTVIEECKKQGIDATDADRSYLSALLPREPGSVELVQGIISGNCGEERTRVVDMTFDWLSKHWPLMRSESRSLISLSLLDLSLKETTNNIDPFCRARALETLRSIKLDTSTLVAFLEDVTSSVHMPEGPPTKKRRRTSRSEMARAEFQSPAEVARLLRRLTLVLELIDASDPGSHPGLFKNLFSALGELQQLKQQSGSDLVYLQSLILSSLTPIVNRLKAEKNTAEYQSSVRADLLIDCIRHSGSPQVQNAALLLIATLASWVPELILHNLMPIFTFIGSTLLRQQDDYSAHVVDQTISRVVPELATSLRAKHRHFLTGVADLLLSFTAAFEHIPQHRRLKLFAELARTLGAEDSLPAIIALLIDRYPSNKARQRFTVELLLSFEPIVTLHTFQGYLTLVEDTTGPKGKISETLFSLSEKQPNQVEGVLHNLLSSLADLTTDERLRSHAGRAFKSKSDPTQPRTIFASIVETVIRISKIVAGQAQLYQCCSRLLGTCLEILPTHDLVKSCELLLANPNHDVGIAAIRSIEVRAGNVLQNDQPSVSSLVEFLPSLDTILEQSKEVDVKRIALSCADSIIARFGKRDATVVAAIAQTVGGPQSLLSGDNKVRILALLCLTSIIDVLEDEAISLLPTVLPASFDYLREAIQQEDATLHNAVFALLTNTVQRLGFIFSRDYLVPVFNLSQQSAIGDLDEACDEERNQFYEKVSQCVEAQEVFTAIKSTWAGALSQGYEAAQEQLQLMQLTIESQSKTKLIKASSTLFDLLLHLFELKSSVGDSSIEFDDAEVELLEDTLVEGVISMTLKLNDATFRPFFVRLVDRAGSSMTFYKFLAAFFDKFKSIVTSYSSYIVEQASRLLKSLEKQKGTPALRTALLRALQKSFQHDQDGFWQSPSHFSAIMAPLLAQLTTDAPATAVIPTVTELAACCASAGDAHREMNAVLLGYMRAEQARTRLAAVLCEQSLTQRLGEEWLGLLPEMLPFVSELREDDDEGVERETVRWIGMVERILGEDLEGMLS